MENIKEFIKSVRIAFEQNDYNLASQLSLKCALYFFNEAKKQKSSKRDYVIKLGKIFMGLYETSQQKLNISKDQSLIIDTLVEKVAESNEVDIETPVTEENQSAKDEINNPISLRPYLLDEYIGQNKIVEHLKMLIDASKKRNDSLDHILLYGSAGLGKTSLAQIISHEMNAHFIELNATTLNDIQSFANILKNLSFKDILFIDEIHALSSSISDMLLTVLEDYQISYIEGKTINAKVVNAKINKFTFIGATTHPGLLSKPFLDRMIHKFKMERYSFDELSIIIKKSCLKWSITIEDEAALEIAKRSRSIPRIANNFVRTFRDIALIKSTDNLTKEDILLYFTTQEIDEEGITNEDRRLLATLIDRFQGGPVSLMSLASVIGDNENIIEFQIEPYLVQKGFITVTKSGRVCTEAGYTYMSEYGKKGDNNHEFE